MSNNAYFSFIEQTLHYFDRPHDQALITPVDCAAAWRGDDMPSLEDLAFQLSTQQADELRNAVSAAAALGKPV
jgi:hypothetical protein